MTYTVKVPSSVEEITINATKEDSTANIVGTGKFKVSEGENKFDIVVTSQKGTKKTYTIKVTVLDEKPIDVKINNNTYTIIKRKSSLKIPESGLFTDKEITINDTKIPALYNETTNYTLIGLKDNDGNSNLYIYNEEDNSYTLYQEMIFNMVKVNIIDKKVDNLESEKININDNEITAYKLTNNYYLFYATNIESSATNLYMYEENEGTIQIFNKDLIKLYEEKLEETKYLVYIMSGLSVLFGILIIVVAASKNKKHKKKDKEKTILNEDKKSKKDNNLEWTKEVKKVDKKLVLEKEDKTKSIKEVEKDLKKEIDKAKKELDKE